MTSAGGDHRVPTYQQELDPLLLQPARLFIACWCADMRWHEQVAAREAMQLSAENLSLHVDHLHAAGYLEIHKEKHLQILRLTPLGLDRLADHVTALQKVVRAASGMLAIANAGSLDKTGRSTEAGVTPD